MGTMGTMGTMETMETMETMGTMGTMGTSCRVAESPSHQVASCRVAKSSSFQVAKFVPKNLDLIFSSFQSVLATLGGAECGPGTSEWDLEMGPGTWELEPGT